MLHLNKWEKKYDNSNINYNIGDYIKLKENIFFNDHFKFCKIIDITKNGFKVLIINNSKEVIENINIKKSDIIKKLNENEISIFNYQLLNTKYSQ